MTHLQHHHDSAPAAEKASAAVPAMRGFDPEFTDITDYILRVTRRIWEGKQVGLCLDYYSPDCPVYTLAGVTIGAAEVTQNTLTTLASFPDRTLEAVNLIWAGDEQTGFHTSHLIRSHMTNTSDSEYGVAAHKEATILVIAHCVIKNNRIIEEWLVRDNYSLAQQLGKDPQQVAQHWALKPVSERLTAWRDEQRQRLQQQVDFQRQVAGDDPESFIRSSLHNIWNARMVGDVYQSYAPDAVLHGTPGCELHGHAAIIGFYMQMLGTLSELRFSADYVCQQPNRDRGVDLAVRWSISGVHTGSARYGKPSGQTLYILGESHYRLIDGKIVEEWTVFDELSVLTDIYRARAAQNTL
ncbi:MAG: ester cyclase [Cellvibrionales bacterium]|nr:ester cyclase [Cellvibrionales bacterium]